MFEDTRSGRIYRNEGSIELETSPLISPPWESKGELGKVSLRSAISLIKQRIPRIPLPPTPLLVSPSSTPSSPTPPPPPPQFNMASTIKLPVFKGVGNEDLNQFWFVVMAVWEEQGVIDENTRKTTLVSALQDHALMWYIKNSNDNPNIGITDIQATLNREFSRPKLETQSIIRFK